MLLKKSFYAVGIIGLWAGCIVTMDANGTSIAICGATIILVTKMHSATQTIVAALQPPTVDAQLPSTDPQDPRQSP